MVEVPVNKWEWIKMWMHLFTLIHPVVILNERVMVLFIINYCASLDEEQAQSRGSNVGSSLHAVVLVCKISNVFKLWILYTLLAVKNSLSIRSFPVFYMNLAFYHSYNQNAGVPAEITQRGSVPLNVWYCIGILLAVSEELPLKGKWSGVLCYTKYMSM